VTEQEEKGAILVEALAEYFDVEPEAIHGFIFAVERDDEEAGLTLSSSWSAGTPSWNLMGYLEEAHHHVERTHRGITPHVAANGSDKPAPNRAARRGRGRRGR
jgi:hypothetical protein